ncbi:MAG: N-acetylmuramoyl-L-alanine amidase [Hyphomicrobiales bacterium]|nr:MAG: N-acetylmuramoyl-L-alanine amidase [Hyphomicrobiales bacterium]
MIERPDSPVVGALHPSANFGERKGGAIPSILLLHYTGVESAAKAISWLSDPVSEVSCHYVVDEAGFVTQMVAEAKRAWHAGAGAWAGDTDINSSSIGIEIQNVGHAAGYPPFPDRQIAAVIALCRDIVARHHIRAERVLAHSDVAPSRKIDPGERFPWATLAAAGIGHWVPPAPVRADDTGVGLGTSGPFVAEMQTMLRNYGYAVMPSGHLDTATEFVITAFQRHFRPARVDGRIDQSTFATLQALSAALPAETMIT